MYLISSLRSNACSFRAENRTHSSLQSMGNFPHSFYFSRSSLLSKTNVQYFSITLTASFLCFICNAFFLFSSNSLCYASFLSFSFKYVWNNLRGFNILKNDCIRTHDLYLRRYNLTLNPLNTRWIMSVEALMLL